jgi:hypothetical protein
VVRGAGDRGMRAETQSAEGWGQCGKGQENQTSRTKGDRWAVKQRGVEDQGRGQAWYVVRL